MPEMTIWEDDLPEEVMERLTSVLCEIGIYVKHIGKGTDGDYTTNSYEFVLAEPLPEDEMLPKS